MSRAELPAARAPERPVWVAGIINHGHYEDVTRCLASLRRQTRLPDAVYVFDTGVDPARFHALSAREPAVSFELGPNRGYAGGANHLLRRLDVERPDAAYVLLLNPDVELDPPFAARLLEAMEARPCVALGSGKLLRPGRERIDSAGIVLPRHRRPRDRGSGEPDQGQFERPEPVFAVSGAALMLRRAALPALAVEGEVFDEDFFVYHEDTDLAWRAHRLGWEVWYEPRATAVHGRHWRRERRFSIPVEVRRHSFKNHYLQLLKNERGADFLRNLPWLLVWEVLRLGYVLLRDRTLLRAYRAALLAAPRAWAKRKAIDRTGGAQVAPPASSPTA